MLQPGRESSSGPCIRSHRIVRHCLLLLRLIGHDHILLAWIHECRGSRPASHAHTGCSRRVGTIRGIVVAVLHRMIPTSTNVARWVPVGRTGPVPFLSSLAFSSCALVCVPVVVFLGLSSFSFVLAFPLCSFYLLSVSPALRCLFRMKNPAILATVSS